MSTLYAVFGSRAQIWIGILIGIAVALLVGKVAWRRVILWCKGNGPRMVFAACGFLIGAAVILTCGERPGDALASLIGAFAGIVAAVGGGLWLWEVQEDTARKRVLKFIDGSLGQLIASMADVCLHARDRKTLGHVIEGLGEISSSIDKFESDQTVYSSHLIEIGVNFQEAFFDMQRRLRLVLETIRAWDKHYAKLGSPYNELSWPSSITVDELVGDLVHEIGNIVPCLRVLAPTSSLNLQHIMLAADGFRPGPVLVDASN